MITRLRRRRRRRLSVSLCASGSPYCPAGRRSRRDRPSGFEAPGPPNSFAISGRVVVVVGKIACILVFLWFVRRNVVRSVDGFCPRSQSTRRTPPPAPSLLFVGAWGSFSGDREGGTGGGDVGRCAVGVNPSRGRPVRTRGNVPELASCRSDLRSELFQGRNIAECSPNERFYHK